MRFYYNMVKSDEIYIKTEFLVNFNGSNIA